MLGWVFRGKRGGRGKKEVRMGPKNRRTSGLGSDEGRVEPLENPFMTRALVKP